MSASAGVAPEPRAIRVESSGVFFVLPAGKVLFRQRVRASAPVGVAPEPPAIRAESSRGFFVLPVGEVSFRQRVHASAPAGVAPEPPGGSGRTVWGVLFQRACVFLV